MRWESDETREEDEPRDWTKWLWAAVGLGFAAMIAAVWYTTGETGYTTQARVKDILITFDPTDPVDRADAQEMITLLRERLIEGESFAKIAKNFSNDPQSAGRGGDLGWNARDALTGPVEEYVWSAPIGELSNVILSTFGFHLIIVTERQISAADVYESGLMKRLGSDASGEAGNEGAAP